MRWTQRARFLVENLDLVSATGVPDARWEHFQLAHLTDDSTLRCEVKSRQIAASFTFAAEAVANAVLNGISSMFQSINLDEAREKIIYARAIYDNLMIGGLPKITQPDTTTSIGFDNGARIISIPGTPHRGKARFWVYLDEWAHQKHDRANYTAAFPVISKGGKLRGASSPMGAGGLFWEVYGESMRPYSGYTRKATPWWEIHAFCTDARRAATEVPAMVTADRVDRFGNERIKLIYENMPEDDFMQEYEITFLDEVSAWISWELIRANQQQDLTWYHITNHNEVDRLIQDVRAGINAGQIEPQLVGGVDIGRTKDLTEFVALGKSTAGQLPVRFMVSLAATPYEHQENCIYRLLTELPFVNALIDQNGIGNQLAETLSKATIAQGVSFTNASKELWAVETKLKMEKSAVPLPVDRDLAYQIHSIKKSITAAKNNVFDTKRNEKHHADKFWALALAIWAARTIIPPPGGEVVSVPMNVYKSRVRLR